MNNSNQRRTKLLATMAIFGICMLTTSAQACLSYKNTQEQTKLWGLPEENTSSVQAVLPAQARVCIDEQLPGSGGEEWARVSFYILDDVRYSARGWVNIERFTNTIKGEPTTPAIAPAITLPSPSKTSPEKPDREPATASNRDDDAMVDTLQAQRRELDLLKEQNEQLQKRLGGMQKMSRKTPDEITKTKADKMPALPAADPDFLQQGWRLNSSLSKLSVESVFDHSLIETHRFTKLSGKITRAGNAQIKIALGAINSGVKIRDIRLSHLLFQSEKFPSATISAKLDKQQFAPLQKDGKQHFDLKIKLKLHGVEKEMTTKVKLTRMSDGRLSVASLGPVMISATDFALGKGITKLINIAGGKSIVPVVPVRFTFIFDAKT